jgi:antitoxin (DNA-binding transcriptional repressor) of toxin-antitoxin stability system
VKTYALNPQTPPLASLIEEAKQGEEIILTEQGQPIVRLVAIPKLAKPRAKAGSLKGKIRMSPDFDAPLDGFDDANSSRE